MLKLLNLKPGSDFDYTLLIFPHAGGSPNQYKAVVDYLPSSFGLMGVLLAGREGFYTEYQPDSLESLAVKLVIELSKVKTQQLVFWGHSMGALLAYETAQRLTGRLKHLFVSGHVAPHVQLPRAQRHLLNDAELKACLLELSGTPQSIMNNDEFMEMVLPMIRSDFKLCDTYEFKLANCNRLNCPITAFSGAEDVRMGSAGICEWSKYTKKDFKPYFYEGNHFFIFEQMFLVVQKLVQRIYFCQSLGDELNFVC